MIAILVPIAEPVADRLIDRIETFLVDVGMAPTTFGLRALNDAGFVFNLRAGRDPKESTRGQVMAFMRAHLERAAK